MDRSVMPSDLSVKAVGLVLGASENPAGPTPDKFTPPAQAPPTLPPVIVANPSLRFDPVSGLVVIEFHDAAGDVTTSIPTLRQLEAYRIWGQPSEYLATTGAHGSATSAPTGKDVTATDVLGPATAQQAPAPVVHVSATGKG